MAKPGPKRKDPLLKVVNGTYRPCNDGEGKPAPKGDSSKIERPTWLKGEARKEWERVLPILTTAGMLDNADQSMLVMYCTLYGNFVEEAKKGNMLKGTERAELRRLAESFGLTPGARTAIHVGGQAPKGNKFGNNGKRPRA